jgi:hypothetical protein
MMLLVQKSMIYLVPGSLDFDYEEWGQYGRSLCQGGYLCFGFNGRSFHRFCIRNGTHRQPLLILYACQLRVIRALADQGRGPYLSAGRLERQTFHVARSTRVSISLRSAPKSIGLVKSASAPPSKASALVSASP